ncbi:hypothetical protein GQR58_029642 [Nymphon striatum]|nr:hypothetical protein GQR58_029642 [Nymphon striatum]
MRKADRAINTVDLEALAVTRSFHDTGWAGTQELVDLLLDAPQAPIDELVAAAHDGAGVEGLINVDPSRLDWSCSPAFLAFDTGRYERRQGVHDAPLPSPAPGDIAAAVLSQDHRMAVSHVLALPIDEAADQLENASMEDTAGSFIVMAHLVKCSVAARAEAEATGSRLPLAAAARFVASPRGERFVTRAAREAIDFVRTGQPPTR